MNDVSILALLVSFAESAVRTVEANYGDGSGPSKRLAAFKAIKDRLFLIQRMFGALPEPADSTVLGVIDATVEALHLSGEFPQHNNKDGRSYAQDAPPAAFEYTAAAGVKKWARIDRKSGEILDVRLVSDPQNPGGPRIPEPENDEPEGRRR